jgi:hypothetical protein
VLRIFFATVVQSEVRLVVKKRSDFEYRLRRRAADKDDFIRYIQYEMTLDKLLAVGFSPCQI